MYFDVFLLFPVVSLHSVEWTI